MLVDGCGGDGGETKEQTASLQTALLRNHDVRGPRYMPPRAPFEIRRSAATVIAGAGWNARRRNSRALLSFGLTSSRYRVKQPFIGS